MPLDPRDKAAIIARYKERFAVSISDACSLGTNEDAMIDRYKMVVNLINSDKGSSLLDVGCGFGGLREYLPEQITDYHGVDIVDSFLPKGDEFKVLDITADPIDEYDYIVCLAVFNNLFQYSDNMTIVHEVMEKLYKAARVGVAIDFITHPMLGGPTDDGKLFYYDSYWIILMANLIADWHVIKGGYVHHEMLLFLYKGDA